MNSAIEIHDSELESFALVNGSNADLCFSSVYIHKSEGKPGVDAGTGWTQRARLLILNANIKRAFTECPAELVAGYLKLGESILDNQIPIPLNYSGKIELSLESWNDQAFLIYGDGATLELIGEPEYVEEFPPDS